MHKGYGSAQINHVSLFAHLPGELLQAAQVLKQSAEGSIEDTGRRASSRSEHFRRSINHQSGAGGV
jgi:hypothetical protein